MAISPLNYFSEFDKTVCLHDFTCIKEKENLTAACRAETQIGKVILWKLTQFIK